MSGRHCAAEDRRGVAETHLAVARSQKIGNGILGLQMIAVTKDKKEPFLMALFLKKTCGKKVQ